MGNDYTAFNLLNYILWGLIVLTFYFWQNQLSLVPAASAKSIRLSDWMLLASTEEKTEAATPHKKQEARKKGQVAKSSDLNGAIVVLAIIVLVFAFRDYLGLNLTEYIRHILADEMTSPLDDGQIFRIFKLTLYSLLKIMAPIFAVAVISGLAANFLQMGFILSSEAMKPKLSHINPLEGIKRIFSKRALFEFLKTLIKISILGLVIYKLLKNNFPNILLLLNMDIVAITTYCKEIIYKICVTVAAVFLIIAILDFVYQKWQFNQTLKMSKYEVKKEMQQEEGDPLIKSKLREKQRLVAMRRMMQSVPDAAVVITNPTHLAVALKYDDKIMQAPQIIAKGAGYVAQTIKEKARENHIPIIEDKPVARALYKSTEIGDFVPVELYQAVAGILAVIYSLRRNRS